MRGCGHSIVTVRRNSLAGATTYAQSSSVTVNGACTVSTTGSPPTSTGPASAGRKVASDATPVWRPVPRREALRPMDRLALRFIGRAHQRLELVDDLHQAVERALRPQELTVAARRIPRHGRARLDVADHAALHGDPRAAPDRHVVGDPRLARQEHVVSDVRAPRDPRLPCHETAGADAHVVAHLHQVVDLGPGTDDGVVHAAAVDRG